MLAECAKLPGEMKVTAIHPNRRAPRHGLTIVELLVVMAVIVVLSAMGFTGWARFQSEATLKTTETQRDVLSSSMDRYLAIYGNPPEKEDLSGRVLYGALTGDGAGADGIPCTGDDTAPDGAPDRPGQRPILDPGGRYPIAVATRGVERVLVDPYGQAWRYRAGLGANNPKVDIWSVGPDGVDGTPDDIHNW